MPAIARSAVTAMRTTLVGLLLGVASCANSGQTGAAAGDAGAMDLRLADATLAAGAPETALRVLDRRLQQSPHDEKALVRQGRALMAVGRPLDAAQSFATALATHPGSQEAQIGLAGA